MSEPGEEPTAELPRMPYDPGPASALASWSTARERLESARIYWLSTVRANGRPHVMPVWAVWLENGLWFSTSERSVKGRNVERNPTCTVSLGDDVLQVVVEGTARRVTSETELERFVGAYTPKYEWPLTVTGAGVSMEDGNSGYVYAVEASTVFALSDDGSFTSTRWRL